MKKDNHTEQRILKAAEEEFIAKGLHGAKMLAIARKAGITLAHLHRYFSSKEDIFQVIFYKKLKTAAKRFLLCRIYNSYPKNIGKIFPCNDDEMDVSVIRYHIVAFQLFGIT